MWKSIMAFQAHPLHVWRHDDEVRIGCIGFHAQDSLDPLISRFDMRDIDTAIEQKYLNLLGTIGKEQDIDVRMLASRAVEYRARQIGIKNRQQIEQFQRRSSASTSALSGKGEFSGRPSIRAAFFLAW